ncbi:hypothetical protein ZHAS_00009010 [Anopheles sinensis]|uniref:Uncharacterized protein n=1 Tax=Anopheles sinensis TaxID=74873 RepID=A0A084VTY1_ANOSI|nr:hypothetical protein ZHAS_00009010 [Anopheles sinensis]
MLCRLHPTLIVSARIDALVKQHKSNEPPTTTILPTGPTGDASSEVHVRDRPTETNLVNHRAPPSAAPKTTQLTGRLHQ